MAKISQAVLLLATAICISSLAGSVHCHDKVAAAAAAPVDESHDLMVIGKVYCDTCRVGFLTPVSEGVEGANVTLECKDREGGHVVYSVGAVTDARGVYQIPVKGDHAEEVCEVEVQQSSRFDCDELVLGRHRGRINLTKDNGIITAARYVNPLGFLKKVPLEKCPQVLAQMGLLSTEVMLVGVTSGKAAGMKIVAVPSLPAQADDRYSIADSVLQSLLKFQLEPWGLPKFEDCKILFKIAQRIATSPILK